MTVVYHILRYLKGTSGKGLLFQKSQERGAKGYLDADWAGSIADSRSTLEFCTKLWGNLVTWRNKKQSVVARSSAKVEFKAIAQGICELIWLERLMEDLKIPLT